MIFIEGLAFPLGVLNSNNQGIPFSEAENSIKSLKTSVVRVCSRVDPHFCDAIGDPNSEIGHIVDAGQDGDNVRCKAAITDSIAQQKIEDGTWKPYWSIFGTVQDWDSGGWAHGIVIESISLVNDPAWDNATWSIVSASKEGKHRFHTVSQFTITASVSEKNGDETITKELEEKIKTLEDQVKEKDLLIEELSPKVDSIATLETQVAELTASKSTLEKEIVEKTKMIASLEKEKAGSVSMDILTEKIAAAIEEHDKEVNARNTLSAARSRFVAARKAHLGVDTAPEEFNSLSASDFEKLAADHEGKIAASGADSGHVDYPAGGSSSGNKVPIFDPDTKSFSPYKGV